MKDFDKKYQLSIIVPVYNVERYIRPCMESIFQQGLDDKDYEVIIVNDGTQDRSMEVIQDIISQHDNVTVINQENLSLSVARNNGIAIAKGEYILMPDPDDLLIENSLGVLLEKALDSKADLVVADFLEMTDDRIKWFHGVSQKHPKVKEKTGEQLLLEDLNPLKCYVWRTLYRRNFLLDNHLSFVPEIRFQDIPFTHECYIKAKKVLRVYWRLNIYRIGRDGASTSSFDKTKAYNYCVAIAKTWALTKIDGLNSRIVRKIQEDIYVTYVVLIHNCLYCNFKESELTHLLYYLRQEVPDLNFAYGVRQRITTFMIWKMPRIYIRLMLFRIKMRG